MEAVDAEWYVVHGSPQEVKAELDTLNDHRAFMLTSSGAPIMHLSASDDGCHLTVLAFCESACLRAAIGDQHLAKAS